MITKYNGEKRNFEVEIIIQSYDSLNVTVNVEMILEEYTTLQNHVVSNYTDF